MTERPISPDIAREELARLRQALAGHFFYSMRDREFVAGLLEAEEQLTLTDEGEVPAA